MFKTLFARKSQPVVYLHKERLQMKKFSFKVLVPLAFLGISFYAIANHLDGWGWGFFLALLTFNNIED